MLSPLTLVLQFSFIKHENVPTSRPSWSAQAAMEAALLTASSEAAQSRRVTLALSPSRPWFVFTPQRKAVAVHAESGICAFTQ